MPPKADPSQVVEVCLRCIGGEVGNSSALAPKLGPLGLNPRKVGDDIAKVTGDWKGLKITVKLVIQNRQAAIEVVPTAAAMVIRALKEPSRDRKKEKHRKHNGNVTFAEIYDIAKVLRKRSLAREMTGTVKEVVGTCVSVGCTIDGQSPAEIIRQIEDGEREVAPYDV
eukprot:CAMPEP_0184645954 /NCGR_PEP_ID=MMETSP0308-20130426/2584_1 /TAXON_ID=38269 /ORGANISM="Gloeochaete witrockiana, Strain SAG 46.84" /LENGTH=167 /DNA_ID=CAMNT_0027075517 /DNA_START=64 /DNA_END=567 /DNA_ORIENTATION=-